MSKKLNTKKKTFAEEYIVTLNGAEAARKAGYSHKTAKEKAYALLNEPLVQEYIAELMSERAKKTKVTAEYVITKIKETLEKAEGDHDYKNILKAAELLGKHLKLFTDVQQQNHVFTQMGKVTVSDDNGGEMEMQFNVGQDPDHARPN